MKKLVLYIWCFAAAGVQLSCKKELNALPTQSKVEGNVVVDQKSAEVALNGAYLRFAEGGDDRGTPSVMWAQTHEVNATWLAGYLTYPYGGGTFDENSRVTADDYGVAAMWAGSYALINAANGVIEQVGALDKGKFTGNRQAEIIAEAKILRAYGHQNLLRYFTQFYDVNSPYGLLIRKQFVTTNNIAGSRSPVKESYDFVLADLDEGIASAPSSSLNYYSNKWVAKALKARVLMIRGAAGDYAQVVALTQDIIQNSPYRLEASVRDIFSTKGLDSKEVLFGITPKPNQVTKNDVYFYNNTAGYLATDALKALIENDPREGWLIGDIGGSIGITKYAGTKVEVSYAIRLTEMYLLESEGIVRSGGDINAARALLKTVQEHAGVTDFTAINAATTADTMLRQLYNETARNLSFEDGQEWSALLRLPLAAVLSVKPAITDKDHFILPIPKAEFDKNPQIGAQNPTYSKN